jgi:hypothetical protein
MLDEEGPGRPPTDPSPTTMMLDTTDSTNEPAGEGPEPDRPAARGVFRLANVRYRSDPRVDGVAAIAARPPAARHHLSRRPARVRNGLTGRRTRRTRPRRLAQGSRPPDEPPGPREPATARAAPRLPSIGPDMPCPITAAAGWTRHGSNGSIRPPRNAVDGSAAPPVLSGFGETGR